MALQRKRLRRRKGLLGEGRFWVLCVNRPFLVGLNCERCRIDAEFFAFLCFFLRVPSLILYFIASLLLSPFPRRLSLSFITFGTNIWSHDSPLDCKFFFFSFPFSVSQYRLFFFFFFFLERANVMQSDEKKSVGFFNCNVFFNFILTGFFFNRLFDLYFFNCKRGRVMKGKTLYRASVLN